MVAAVEGDAGAQAPLHIGLHIVCKSLCCHADGVSVHSVGSYAHDSAESAGAEFKITVEGVLKDGRIPFHEFFDLVLGLLVEVAVQPRLGDKSEICCHVIKSIKFIYYFSTF